MGCDIHAYLEYFNTEDKTPWVDVYAADIAFNRNYNLFNALAGVRGFGGPFDPRGLPKKPPVSLTTFNEYYLKIIEGEAKQPPSPFWSSERTISRVEALTMIERHNLVEEEFNGCMYIRDPNWHSASHLELNELITVRRSYLIDVLDYDCSYKGKKRKEVLGKLKSSDPYDLMKLSFPEIECAPLNATIASMIAIENSGPHKARLVFWFDS